MRTSESSADMQTAEDRAAELRRTPGSKKRRLFYGFLILFILGLMYGSLLLRENGDGFLSGLSTIQQEAVTNKASQSFATTFLVSLASSGVFMLMTFLLGFSAIAQPVTGLLLFVKGLGIGSSIGYFYLNYGLAGIGYSALFILPSAVIATFALILSARESLSLSNLLFSSFYKETACSKDTLKLYLFKHLILFGFLLASALLDGVMTLIFAGIFEFG